MATELLATSTTNATGAGAQITGDFLAIPSGNMAGGVMELQFATADTDALYKPCGSNSQWTGPGTPAYISNPGTLWFRGVLKGCLASMLPASGKLEYDQAA